MILALVGLGANIGAPATQLQRASLSLAQLPDTTLEAVSPVYRSAPMGPQDQPPFLNACAMLHTRLDPHAFLAHLQCIETNQGRQRIRAWGERCIDLDLLLHGETVLSEPQLTLPHAGLGERDFVLMPLIDLLGPDWRLPSGDTLSDLAAAAPSHGLERVDLDLNPATAQR